MGCITQLHLMHQQSLKLAAPTGVFVLPTQTNERFFFQENPSKSNRALHQVSISPIWVPPGPPKKMAKKMQKGSKQPPVVVMVNFREIKHPLHQATVYATTFGASFDNIFDTKRSKAFRQRAACEDPMGVKNTWGVICGNPRKPHENHCILYIYIYLYCLHFGSFFW